MNFPLPIPKSVDQFEALTLNRQAYWIGVGIMFLASLLVGLIGGSIGLPIPVLEFLILVLVGIPAIAYLVQGRFNNMGYPMIWAKVAAAILGLIPGIGWVVVITLGVWPPKVDNQRPGMPPPPPPPPPPGSPS